MYGPQIASTVMQVIGGMIQSWGHITGGELKYRVGRMKSSAASFEGRMQNMEMQTNAWQWKQQGLRMKSQQTVSAVAAGISLDSESYQNIVKESMSSFESDVNNMLKQGEIYQLFGDAAARMYEAEGRMQRAAGYMNAFTAQVNTASGIMQTWGGSMGGMGGMGGGG